MARLLSVPARLLVQLLPPAAIDQQQHRQQQQRNKNEMHLCSARQALRFFIIGGGACTRAKILTL